MNVKNTTILAISFITATLVGCGGSSGSSGSSDDPILIGTTYFSNEGGILLAKGKNTEALFNNVLIQSSSTSQAGNTLKITQLTDPTGISDISNDELTATYDGSGIQVTGFNTTTYLYQLPKNNLQAGDFAGSYNSDTANWVINSDNTFTATDNTTGCLLTGELVYAPIHYIVGNTVATSCSDSRFNGNYPDGYAVYGDLPNGKDWLGIVIWKNGVAIWDHVPLN